MSEENEALSKLDLLSGNIVIIFSFNALAQCHYIEYSTHLAWHDMDYSEKKTIKTREGWPQE